MQELFCIILFDFYISVNTIIPMRKFYKKNAVFCIAFLLACFTSCIVWPDKQYLSYFDMRTVSCLFCTLAVIQALRNIRFFKSIARWVIAKTENTKAAVITLVAITFFVSMLIANDMALLTFLPLGYFVLSAAKQEKYMAFTFVMQNIAANLGGMLTPFGNPQNLYLYSRFDIPNGEFFEIMAPPFFVAVALIFSACLVYVKKEKLKLPRKAIRLPVKKTCVYLVLFAFAILVVFRTVPYWIGVIVVVLSLWHFDKRAL